MKKILLVLGILMLVVSFCQGGDVSVKGYYRKNGTYVAPHHRSSPDNTVRNNYGYEGNVNPYTGTVGQNHYKDNPTSQYYQPTIQQSQKKYNNQQSRVPENQRSSSSSGSLFNSGSESLFDSNSNSLFGSNTDLNSGSQLGSDSRRSSGGLFDFDSE